MNSLGILEFLRLYRASRSFTAAITMRKWQELILNSLLNFSMALVAGGFLKLVLDKGSVISSVIVIVCGVYLFGFLSILTYNSDKEK